VRINEKFTASLRGLGRRRERTHSSPSPAARDRFRAHDRTDRISEVTEESSTATHPGSATGSIRSELGRTTSAQGFARPGSRTDSVGSEEVIGKLELDDGPRRGGYGSRH